MPLPDDRRSFAAGVSILLIVATAVVVAIASPRALAQEPEVPRGEVFAGYSYLHPGGTLTTGKLGEMPKGFAVSGTYNVSKAFGLTLDLAPHWNDRANIETLMFGPTFSIRAEDGARVFGEIMGGLHRLSPQILPPDNNFGARIGGGIDLPIARHVSLRMIQADYTWAHHNFFSSVPAGTPSGLARPNLRGVEVRMGLVFGFGSIGPPPQQPAATCTAQPLEVFAGEPVTVTANATNFREGHPLTYQWSSNGGKVSGRDTTAQVDTTGLGPGNYTVSAHITDPKAKKYNEATCTVNFGVKEKPKHPPTISCTANPTSVQAGTSSTITCQTSSPDNVPVTTEFSSSAGKVTGSGNTATLDTTGAAPGAITVTAKAADARGLTADTTATVTVEQPPPPPPQASKINEIEFPNPVKPWRVDNTAKAVLDDVTLRMQREPDAKLVIVGMQDPTERRKNLAAERAVDTKAYLVAEKGIDASRIEVRTGTAGGKKAEMWLVPAGATFNQADTQPVDETRIKPIPDHPAPVHGARRKAAPKKPAQ